LPDDESVDGDKIVKRPRNGMLRHCYAWRSLAVDKRTSLVAAGEWSVIDGTYSKLKRCTKYEVPHGDQEQILLDAPRTFAGLPKRLRPQSGWKTTEASPTDTSVGGTMRGALVRVLLIAMHTGRSRGGPAKWVYTQGMNILAATCLALCGWEEEFGYLLFLRLLEDGVGSDFFSSRPPMMGYRAITSVTEELSKKACPQLHQRLGDASFSDVVSMLASRLYIPCFMSDDGLSESAISALWADILSGSRPPMIPLMQWFVGLLADLEADMLTACAKAKDDCEATAVAFDTVFRGIQTLSPDWRPKELPASAEVISETLEATRQKLTCQGAA
jgi:hypothetical protein